MTPEERASKIINFYLTQRSFSQQEIEQDINAAIRDAVADSRAQARAALEPFARLACAYDGWNSEGGTIVAIGQLRAARDAYVALGGKLLDN